MRAEVYPLTLYRSYGDMQSQPGLLVGKINTKGSDSSIPPRQILGYDVRMSVVSASVDNQAKIYPGMKVYIVKRERDHQKNRAALIVAEGEIDSISDTVFSGRVAQIRGQFSMVSRQHFVAVPQASRSREGDNKGAHEYFMESERHRHEKDFARSAQKLQHARELEPNNPLINLRYAELALQNGAEDKARAALRKAFEERRRLEDVNEYLKLGSLYLAAEVRVLPMKSQDILKSGTALLAAVRQFEKDLGQFGKDLTPPKSSTFRLRHSRFSAQYHLQYGILLRQIAAALREYSPEAITKVLGYGERDVLYAPIETRVARERVLALPRKAWDRAYSDAAITHFELALKKDRQSEAGYELIDLCDSLWEGADNNRRQQLKEIITRYAPVYLEAAHEDQRMGRVRIVLNKVSQA
ncbi:MAG: tetratricopeptide repeat protein [Spirochaetota bacterium]